MPRRDSINHPVRRTMKPRESFELYQTCDRGFPVEAGDEELYEDHDAEDIPIGTLPGAGASQHNVNTITQPSITVQSSIRRLKATEVEAMDSTLNYSNAEGERAMDWRWRFLGDDKKIIETEIDGVYLVVGTDKMDYFVFLVKDGGPQGYVRFQLRLAVPSHWQKLVFTPHSYIRTAYRGKGYISSIYKWFLNSAGRALLSSDKHSAKASALWKGLMGKYPHQFLNPAPATPYGFVPANEDDKTDKTVVLIAKAPLLKKLLTGIK
jgi:hypothetical protein